MLFQGQTGPQVNNDGANPPARIDKTGCLVISECHGRFFEQTYRGNMFSSGMTVTSIANATFTTADANSATLATAATATPIVGVWNPLSSPVNLVILQANVQLINTALQETGPGGLVWVMYTGQNAISTGVTPFNRKTGLASGSQAKGMAGQAQTGLSSTQTSILAVSSVAQPVSNVSTLQTAAGLITSIGPSVENIDGSLIVPPGGLLGLFCVTTPVAWSAASSLLWEEVAI